MTDEFIVFFHKVLNELIPANARDKIKKAWDDNQKVPEFRLSDASIRELELEYGRTIPWASLRGMGVGHIFAFRPFIVRNAPEIVLQTLIQHELIHIYLGPDYHKPPLTYRPNLDPAMSPVQQAGEVLAALEANESTKDLFKKLSEESVSQINDEWGGDEKMALTWLNGFSL
jgi:hypothetical protein